MAIERAFLYKKRVFVIKSRNVLCL